MHRPPRASTKWRAEGFTAVELGAKVGVSARTVLFYTAQHLLPAPQFRAAATRYSREHLVRLAAVRYLQRERRASLADIRRQLEPLSAAELEQLASAFLPELRGATSALTLTTAPILATVPQSPNAVTASDAWQRWVVVPGLEVHLHTAASDEVRALAGRLVLSARDGLEQRST